MSGRGSLPARGVARVSVQGMNDRKKRDQLMVERNLLFDRFLKNPLEIGLAIRIKLIDDQISECNERLRAAYQGAELKNT
jgi:hypothetical protein